jgi:hypothetical protein
MNLLAELWSLAVVCDVQSFLDRRRRIYICTPGPGVANFAEIYPCRPKSSVHKKSFTSCNIGTFYNHLDGKFWVINFPKVFQPSRSIFPIVCAELSGFSIRPPSPPTPLSNRICCPHQLEASLTSHYNACFKTGWTNWWLTKFSAGQGLHSSRPWWVHKPGE